MNKYIEQALSLWYPTDHPHHKSYYISVAYLLAELGVLAKVNMDFMCDTWAYDPRHIDIVHRDMINHGGTYISPMEKQISKVWYYLLISCYQFDYMPKLELNREKINVHSSSRYCINIMLIETANFNLVVTEIIEFFVSASHWTNLDDFLKFIPNHLDIIMNNLLLMVHNCSRSLDDIMKLCLQTCESWKTRKHND